MYRILVSPSPVLVSKSVPVKKFDKKLKNIISEMRKTLDRTRDPVGVGLAASQVNISLGIFLMKPSEKSEVKVFINPVITSISKDINEEIVQSDKVKKAKRPEKSKNKLLEGCLSIPNIWGNVERKRELKLSWQDETGAQKTQKFKGFEAVIIQHEIDHLEGILFTKHVIEQGEQLYRSFKNEKGEDEFEEIEV